MQITDTTSDLQVLPVKTAEQLEDFLRLPWRIYRRDPFWVPPLLPLQRQFLDKEQGPFFEIGEAEYFLAYRHGRPVGRLSAHVNHAYDQHHDRDTGFFGFFECFPQPWTAAALFQAAGDWVRRRGKKRLVGPLNFTVYDEMGLLVEGFDSLPAMFQTHNPPYYQWLLTELGFRKVMDWAALRATERLTNLGDLEKRLLEILQAQNLKLTTYRPREMTRRAQDACDLFNEAWSVNWGHVPLSEAQFLKLLKELKPLVRPELVKLILDGDRLVAFGIGVPDINHLVQKLNGKLTLWGKLRLFYEAKVKPLKKVRALVLGVTQRYQNRRLHHAMLLHAYLEMVRQPSLQEADFSLIPENLRRYIRTIEILGAKRYKTFRVFERDV